ncbi:MAG: alpha/beta hydrolase-fold protein [Actinobacteria bacterium]|nr:alpha/beta hydrolase-fold protein [Actinomycetota bacterium]
MSLTGLPLFISLMVFSLGFNVLMILLWNKFKGKTIVRIGQRFTILLLAQLLVIASALVGVNRSMVFYATWNDLLGGYGSYQDAVTHVHGVDGTFLDKYVRSARANPSFRNEGGEFSFVLKGSKSGVKAPIYVYLPPTYGVDPNKKWPVLVLLPGYPGVSTTWFHAMDLVNILRHEVSTGFAHDFVIALPTMTVAPPRDTECTDIPGGPQVSTWLGVDVPDAIVSGLSVSKDRLNWAIAGYSTGGFCAAKIALSYSERFSVSIPIAAYFEPETGKFTGNLFGGSRAVKDANSPLLLAKKLALPSHMLLVGTSKDPGVMGQILKMEKVHNPNLLIDQLIDQHGGHSTKVWKSQLPRMLDWLSTQIP